MVPIPICPTSIEAVRGFLSCSCLISALALSSAAISRSSLSLFFRETCIGYSQAWSYFAHILHTGLSPEHLIFLERQLAHAPMRAESDPRPLGTTVVTVDRRLAFAAEDGPGPAWPGDA